jgi:multicomponent Na+:H+ antiporter subunit E
MNGLNRDLTMRRVSPGTGGVAVRSAIALFVILLGMWLALSGHYTPLLIGFGVGSCLFVTVLAVRMGVADPEGVPVRLLPRALLYVPWLFKEVFVANVDVARRALTPGRKTNVSPRLFDVVTTQKSDLGRVLYANSITLTPGTVSIRVYGKRITVHAIAEDVAEALEKGEMDRKVSRFEGLG